MSDHSAPTGIPFSLRIGVTGHRRLVNQELLRDAVEQVLRRLDAMLGPTPHRYTVLSPLAEGADRLVADQVLAWPVAVPDLAPRLEAVLPLPVEEYMKDFATEASRAEFEALLARADCPRAAPATAVRPAAYLRAGKTVVQGCDVLIAIWDGRPAAGSGGTAEVVQFARHVGRWMFWIHADEGTITEEHRPDTIADTIEYLAVYNRERLSQDSLSSGLESRYRTLQEQARTAGLDVSYPQRVWSHLLPHLVRASRLAVRYQQRHNLAVYGVTSLAVLAVAAVTIQVLLFRQLPQLVWIEVTAMVLILSLLLLSRGRQWHRKWIDYRFLAERLRAQERLTAAGYGLFGFTLVAAFIHVLTGGHDPAGEAGMLASLLIAGAIILPALGAALADIRIHREYSRNAERYGHMAQQLESLSRQIAGAQDMSELLPLLEEANEVMLREQQDWRVIVLFQELEAP